MTEQFLHGVNVIEVTSGAKTDTVLPVNKKIIKTESQKLYCKIKKYFQLCSGIVNVYVDK